MAYKRNYRRYKKRYRKYTKRVAKTASGIGWLASKAWQGVKMLKDVVNTEYKYFDINESTNVDYNGYLPSLCTPTQGDGDGQRDGDRLKMQNLTFRGRLTRNGADATVRVIIGIDKQSKVSTAADVLESTGASTAGPISPKNYDKRFQTKILYDRRWNLTTDFPAVNININKVINTHQQFQAGTTTINSGRLFAIFISNLNANTPIMQYYSRVTFTDN